MPATLKARLEQFHREHNYLPGLLDYLLTQRWADDDTLQAETDRALAQLRQIAQSATDIAALTKNERAFLNTFDHH